MAPKFLDLQISGAARGVVLSAFANALGDGLYIAGAALFFTRGLGIPVAQVGLGLTCAGVLGLAGGVPLGRLADRRGAFKVLIGIRLIQAVAFAAYLLVGRSFWAFLVVATFAIASASGADAASGAIVGRVAAVDPVRLRALMQSVSNVGIAAGTVAAGVAIGIGTRAAYQSIMLGDAASFLLSGVVLLGLTRHDGVRVRANEEVERRLGRRSALRDVPYLALTAANGLMAVQYFVLGFAMPLWVTGHTKAPHWLVSPLILTNTALVVLLQVRFSRAAKSTSGAARSAGRAGLVLGVAMVCYSLAGGVTPAVAIVVLAAAVVLHTVGELLQSAGAYGLSYGFAERDALGEYLAVYGLGIGLCRAMAPGVLAATCLAHGVLGWWGLALLFVTSGLLTPTFATWAGSTAHRVAGASGRDKQAAPLPSAAAEFETG